MTCFFYYVFLFSCQYGDRCKFLHVTQQQSKPNPFGFGTGTLHFPNATQQQKPNPFGFGVQNNTQSQNNTHLKASSNFGAQHQNPAKVSYSLHGLCFFHPACIRPNFSSMVLNCVPPYSACTIFSITYWDVFSWVIFILSLPTIVHFQSVSSHLKTSGQDHLLWHQQIQIPCNILRLNPKHLLTSEFPLQLMRVNLVLPLWLLH